MLGSVAGLPDHNLRMAGKLVISASSSVILESCDGSTEEAEPRSKAKARNTFVSEGAEMSRVSVHARALRLRSAYEDAARMLGREADHALSRSPHTCLTEFCSCCG